MDVGGIMAALVALIAALTGAAVAVGKWWGEFKTQRMKDDLEKGKAKLEEDKAEIENRSKDLDNQERQQKMEKGAHSAIVAEYASILEYRKKEASEFIANRDKMITELKEDMASLHADVADLQQKAVDNRSEMAKLVQRNDECERGRVQDRRIVQDQSGLIADLRREVEEMKNRSKP